MLNEIGDWIRKVTKYKKRQKGFCEIRNELPRNDEFFHNGLTAIGHPAQVITGGQVAEIG